MATAAAKFAPDPKRRRMIATVKIAQKELGLVDDDYRQILFDVTGHTSLTECSEGQLARMIERFKSRGWKPAVTKASPKPRPADHPMARKARALWISLHQLGVVENPADEALEAFACRQLGVAKLQWADQSQGYKLIEALKAMGTRAGWDQELIGVPKGSEVKALRVRLCETILGRLKKLGFAPSHWGIEEAAWQLCGLDRSLGAAIWDSSHLDLVAKGLGDKLRDAKGGTAVYRA